MEDISIIMQGDPRRGGAGLVRFVLLVAHTPNGEVQHHYVAKRLAEEFPDELVAIIVGTGVQRSFTEKLKRW